MPQSAIQQIASDLPKTGVLVGGMSTPVIINNPALIDYKWLTTHGMMGFTFDVWILLLSGILALHTLGLFRGIRWVYRKIRGYKGAEA